MRGQGLTEARPWGNLTTGPPQNGGGEESSGTVNGNTRRRDGIEAFTKQRREEHLREGDGCFSFSCVNL